MNLGRVVLNSGSWKKIWTNYPNWIYTVKIFYHDVTFSRFAVGRNTLPKLGLKLTISWKSSLKGPDLQQSMIKGQFTKNGTFINILAILRPIWPQLCMLNKSASHLRTSFLVLVLRLHHIAVHYGQEYFSRDIYVYSTRIQNKFLVIWLALWLVK